MSTASTPVSHPGGIFTHLRDLANAIRAGDWLAAAGYFAELVALIKDDLANLPPGPAIVSSIADSSLALADTIDQFCDCNEGVKGATVGAFPWGQLVAIMVQVLLSLFAKK